MPSSPTAASTPTETPSAAQPGASTRGTITGVIHKQTWGGTDNDTLITLSEDEFDATVAVLSLDYDEFLRIEDCDETSDSIGSSVVGWGGPFDVHITKGICAFFGVQLLSEVTEAQFLAAKAKLRRTRLLLLVQVEMLTYGELPDEDLGQQLSCKVHGQAPGSSVVSQRISGARLARS